VAVGILKDSDGKYLLGKRLDSQSWAGWWEFPGGKLETNENPSEALKREIYEELGVTINKYRQWTTRRVIEKNKITILYFFLITSWTGMVEGMEGQKLQWVDFKTYNATKVLPPNQVIQHALKNDLPDIYAITDFQETSSDNFFQALKRQVDDGLRLIQIREKNLTATELEALITRIKIILKHTNVRIIINSNISLAYKYQLDGVHLNSKQLYELKYFPKDLLVGVSCHSAKDLEVAEEKNADFAVLGSVKETLTHANLKPIGWKKFNKLVDNSNIPIYSIGGMTNNDIPSSFNFGAIGIASQRGIWTR
jgi:8-oxo-dGTP diphosphatase|tara:strand:- start:429 stop:1355 length:927 start_codon:yes stop_codon:yes gene_type:complete